MNKPSHEELLAACQRGSDDAFRKLFEQYHKRILHIAYRLCGNIQEAEDITQEVFLKVFKGVSNFNASANFFTWLYRITVNLCLDKNRKRRRREKYDANDGLDSISQNFDQAASNQGAHALDQEIWQDEFQKKLQVALSKIKPKLRTVIVLKDIEGLSYREVAQIVDCSKGTISSRLNRGRKQLKNILSQLGIDEAYFQER